MFKKIQKQLALGLFCGIVLIAHEGMSRQNANKFEAIAKNASVAIFTWQKPNLNNDNDEDANEDDQNDKNQALKLVPVPLGSGVAIAFDNKKIKRNYILTAFDNIIPTPNITVASLVNRNTLANLNLRNSLIVHDAADNFALIDLPERLGQMAKLRLRNGRLRPNAPITVFAFPNGKFLKQKATVIKYGRYLEKIGGQQIPVIKLEFSPAVPNAVGGFVVDNNNHIYGVVTDVFREKPAERYASDSNAGRLIGLATPSDVIGRSLVEALTKKGAKN